MALLFLVPQSLLHYAKRVLNRAVEPVLVCKYLVEKAMQSNMYNFIEGAKRMNLPAKCRQVLFTGAASLILFSGCAGSLQNKDGNSYAAGDSTISVMQDAITNANTRINSLEKALDSRSQDIESLKSQLNANLEEPYLRVVVTVLNIRTTPTTVNNNVIAKAEEGAYLRKIGYAGDEQEWYKVEFMIDNYPYIGYVINNEEYIKEELYDPLSFNRLYNRKLITHQWQTEAALEMTKAKFKTLGVYVNGEDPGQKERFLGELSKAFRDHKIYIKPLLTYSMDQITRTCTQNSIEGIMKIEMNSENDAPTLLDIKLFNSDSVILYSASVPLQAIDLEKNLGRRY